LFLLLPATESASMVWTRKSCSIAHRGTAASIHVTYRATSCSVVQDNRPDSVRCKPQPVFIINAASDKKTLLLCEYSCCRLPFRWRLFLWNLRSHEAFVVCWRHLAVSEFIRTADPLNDVLDSNVDIALEFEDICRCFLRSGAHVYKWPLLALG